MVVVGIYGQQALEFHHGIVKTPGAFVTLRQFDEGAAEEFGIVAGTVKQGLEDGEFTAQAFTLSVRFTEPVGDPRVEPIIATTGG